MSEIAIAFPHHLFKNSPIFEKVDVVYLIEESLFFNQYKFHKQKIAFHRASMKAYEKYLQSKDIEVKYIEAASELSDIRKLLKKLKDNSVKSLHITDPTDDWLSKRIKRFKDDFDIQWYENPIFLNSKEDLQGFFKSSKKKFHQTTFYKNQRQDRNILMKSGNPEGGKWTFDTENRKKYPKGKTPPSIHFPEETEFHKESYSYTEKHFKDNYGKLDKSIQYPITFEASEAWLDQFLEVRFHEFGAYEDAIVKEHLILHHSVLSPMMNVGLLLPSEILEKALEYAKKNEVAINSTEGFVRQIMGWREFLRGMYECKGVEQRTKNFWGFSRKIPKSFYTGNTGIAPIDTTIKKVLKTGYTHHIERLMLLGNFMVLCEFDPDEVYKWFMELFIDAYDWVMVPNVYGMSQFADGGLMATKPYISGSNYVMKMGNYKTGDWQEVWDGLFWRFMHEHRDFFESNPRLKMLLGTLDKMNKATRQQHLEIAEKFLEKLDS
ncbi:cryptochrome/photolyase family protein [Galbibacter mesophilus]|uniref:cryptochrome/photolyase family protein n=1 Tax=Galbibacter mesophilus TaxID=379069 RepID=UPI00191F01C9|nr:cryptochrome/photolyase family protein [Galbibacter mesophilus]MCM5664103.1 cryptochrome/photolyase family protein [Galbibacter mesophilus]